MFRINFFIPIEKEDETSEILMEAGAMSVSIQPGERKVSITALFEDITLLRKQFPDESYTVHQLSEDQWKNSWVRYCEPVKINSDTIILPHPLENIPAKYRYPILIDPRDAFGDGSHPTTLLCLEEIYTLLSAVPSDDRDKLSVLDIGTGTGILAILCEKMGTGFIDAVDNDKSAVVRTKENLIRNNSKHINCFHGDITKDTFKNKYNIVIGNLLTGIIEESLENIGECIIPGGTIILSGISDLWAEDMKEIITDAGFQILHHKSLKGWNLFTLVREENRI